MRAEDEEGANGKRLKTLIAFFKPVFVFINGSDFPIAFECFFGFKFQT